jgi:predicted nucleotidyltransferase
LNFLPILQLLQQRLPNLMAVYAFGSQVTGTADKNSDLDLAVLVYYRISENRELFMAARDARL